MHVYSPQITSNSLAKVEDPLDSNCKTSKPTGVVCLMTDRELKEGPGYPDPNILLLQDSIWTNLSQARAFILNRFKAIPSPAAPAVLA